MNTVSEHYPFYFWKRLIFKLGRLKKFGVEETIASYEAVAHTSPIIGDNGVSHLFFLSFSLFRVSFSAFLLGAKRIIKVYCRRYVMTGLGLARN